MAATSMLEKQRTIQERFEAGVNVIHSLPKEGPFQPSNAVKLRFYALYKQIKGGPCNIPKPGFWDLTGRAKWEAWNVCGNMSTELAMQMYVEELQRFVETMPQSAEVEEFLKAIGPFYEIVDEGDSENFEEINREPSKDDDTSAEEGAESEGEGAESEGEGAGSKGEGAESEGEGAGSKGEGAESEGGEASESENDFQETFEVLPRLKSSTPQHGVQVETRPPFDPICLDKSHPLPPLQEHTSDPTLERTSQEIPPSFQPAGFAENQTFASLGNTSHPGLHIDPQTPLSSERNGIDLDHSNPVPFQNGIDLDHSNPVPFQTQGSDAIDGSGLKTKATTASLVSSSAGYSSKQKAINGSPSHTSRTITQEHRRQQTPYVTGGNVQTQKRVNPSTQISETARNVGLVRTGQTGLAGSTVQFDTPSSLPLALQAVTSQLSHLQGNLQSMLQQLNSLAMAVHGLTQLQHQHSSSVSRVRDATHTQAELVPTLIVRRGRLLSVCLRVVPMVIIWPLVVNIIMSFICRRFGRHGDSPLPSWVWGVLTLLHSLMALLQQYSSGIL